MLRQQHDDASFSITHASMRRLRVAIDSFDHRSHTPSSDCFRIPQSSITLSLLTTFIFIKYSQDGRPWIPTQSALTGAAPTDHDESAARVEPSSHAGNDEKDGFRLL
jgi:hypothetical protein